MKKEDTIHPLKLPAGEPQTVDCVDYGFLAVEIPRRIVKAYAKILKFRIFFSADNKKISEAAAPAKNNCYFCRVESEGNPPGDIA
ncbi:MAG: hypothetical protein K1V74_04925 [Muribaculaceae bacterium]